MRFTPAELEIVDKITNHYPQIKAIFRDKLKEELSTLLQAGAGNIQVCQGRCQVLQDLVEFFEADTRVAKRMVAQPLYPQHTVRS